MVGDKVKKIIQNIPIIIFLLLGLLYFSYQNGYYDKYMRDKINVTNQNIERFEIDIKEGRDVTIEDYLEDEKSYATKTGNMSLQISNKLENIISKGIRFIFKKISSIVE